MNIFQKTEDEIHYMVETCRLVSATLACLTRHIRPGVNTEHLNKVAEEFIRDHGATPSFKGYPNPYGSPFPAGICTSVNDEVVHGIPNVHTVLQDGDIISIDCGVLLNGFHGDSCYTFGVGNLAPETRSLLQASKQALNKGIAQAVAGNHLGDIGHAISAEAHAQGCRVIRCFSGHGIGRSLHEPPLVRNYGSSGRGILLKEGMCLAIEPILTSGNAQVVRQSDRWTYNTKDSHPAAHYEHTIVVRRGKVQVLSSFDEIEQLEGNIY